MIAIARAAKQLWRKDADFRNVVKLGAASAGGGLLLGMLLEAEKHRKAKRRNLRAAKRK